MGNGAEQKGTDEREWDAVLWRSLLVETADVMLVVDPEGTIQQANRERFLDRDVVGLKMWTFSQGDRVEAETRLRARLAEIAESRKAVRYEYSGYGVRGGTAWYEVHAVPVVVEGRVERIIWAATDITARKAAQERLEASESRFRALVEHGSDCIVLSDDEGIVTYVSPALARCLDVPPDAILGRMALDFIHPDDREAAYGAGRGAAPGTITAVAVRLRRRDGTYRRVVGTSVNLLDDPAVAAVVGNLRDVTEQRELEQQLHQSQKMEAIGLLAGGVAHDFNNLLAVILGFSELAARKLPPGHPVSQQLSEVFDAARRGGELTRKLLAFSRKQIIQPRPVELGAAAADFSSLLSRVVGEDIEIVVDRASEDVVVRADSVQLEQVLLNLCTNARQAMPKGGKLSILTRRASFDEGQARKLGWAQAGHFGELTVRDTGIGMDAETLTHVFEPFFTTKREGTGLGLATVYGIVRQHGGFVHVDSETGAGTTFRVFLPASTDAATSTPRPHVRGTGPELRGTEAILVAEDSPSLRALVSTTLTELGYSVVATGDGEEAVREYERHDGAFGLVLLDVVMPRMDAREAYDRIHARRPDVRVLFMTGYAPESTQLAQLVQSGRVPLLEKPFTPQALAAKVRSVLDGPPPKTRPSRV